MTETGRTRADARSRIVDVAARLLQEHGPAAVTTRGVADGAGVQAPTIYRLFGDKDGLLEAVAEHVMSTFVAAKAAVVEAAAADDVDPVEDLVTGWRSQIEFGLANPALFRLLGDPDRVQGSAAARAGRQVLEARIHRVALAGRLRVGERRAVDLVVAGGTGVIQTLLSTAPADRDPGLAEAMIGTVLRQILTDTPILTDTEDPEGTGAAAAAIALRAAAPSLGVLSEGERRLLTEWLDRLAADLTR